jgi:hypothetical protein
MSVKNLKFYLLNMKKLQILLFKIYIRFYFLLENNEKYSNMNPNIIKFVLKSLNLS